MNGHRRRTFSLKIIAFLVRPFIAHKFNLVYDRIDVKGPYILVANHNTNFDPVFLGLAVKDFVYIVATENIMRFGIAAKLINHFFKPIIHFKGKKGINTVKEMLSYLKNGYNVGLFPEGNRSFNGLTNDFVSTIGKVVKKSGAKLVTYRFVGGYLTQPRWSTTIRRGKVEGQLVNVYTPDQLDALNETEINQLIKNDIYEDAYYEQSLRHQVFKGKDLALGLESTLFVCPNCRKIGTLSTSGSSITCNCGYNAVYDEYGYINGKSVTELDYLQREFLKYNEVHFSDNVLCQQISDNHSIVNSFECELIADSKGFYLNNELIDVKGMEIFSRNTLILSCNNTYYNIKGSLGFNALKYKYLYEKV